MNRLIENYINGNLADAKRQAKRYGNKAIREGLKEHGFGVLSQVAIADYLKGQGSFQDACDARQRAFFPWLLLAAVVSLWVLWGWATSL